MRFCMQSIKEHNLKANHNLMAVETIVRNLYAIYQRTQSESKSQRITLWQSIRTVCMQSIKEHNLKANHNILGFDNVNFLLYAIYQRTQSESKSQL